MSKFRHLDIFSGIGGFPLAASWTWPDHEVVCFCEMDEFCQKVLRKHWPGVPIVKDVRDVKSIKSYARETVNLITGGPPCQNTSVAAAIHGGRTGKTLWPEMARIIESVHPIWVIIEQPAGNKRWESQVAMDLESIGYRHSRFELTSDACGAPHRRRRVFIVANTTRERLSAFTGFRGSSTFDSVKRVGAPRGTWRSTRTGNCGMDDGLPCWVDRIKSLGNSCDPRVAHEIMKAIRKADEVIT